MTWTKQLLIFSFTACALAWLVAAPVYFVNGPYANTVKFLCAAAMMCTPTIACVGLMLATKTSWPKIRTKITIAPTKPLKKWFAYLGLALGGIFALNLLCWGIGMAFGQLTPDLTNLSGIDTLIEQQVAATNSSAEAIEAAKQFNASMPKGVLLALMLGQMLLGSIINTFLAVGEEAGWRGWLHTHLRERWSLARTIAFTGVLWGFWHTPLIIVGHNYPTLAPLPSVGMMIVFCVLLGALFTWLREHSGSVWPAALAHGAVNATVTLPLLLSVGNPDLSTTTVTMLGWTGWVAMALVIVVAFSVKRSAPSTPRS